jgi:hypothetical protein
VAIVSIICGIIGLLGLIISINNFLYINEYSIFGFFSFALILLALILGIIMQKKCKNHTIYNMATASIVIGLIGIIVQIFPIFHILYTESSIIAYNNHNKSIKFQTIYPIYSGSYCFFCNKYGCKSFAITDRIDSFSIKTKTKDMNKNYTVTVVVDIRYYTSDIEDEIMIHKELPDSIGEYLSGKYASELQPKYNKKVRREIKKHLYTHFNLKVFSIVFKELDVIKVL